MSRTPRTVFISGAAGYIGGMLVDQLSRRSDVEKIIGLDRRPIPEFLGGNEKLVWIHANTSSRGWQKEAAAYAPQVVIHCAWQIREMYGKRELQWKWNVEGSEHVFDFAFHAPSVERLIYFSTASSYGAFRENTLEYLFTEDESFREDEYLYGVEKREVEGRLKKQYEEAGSKRENSVPIVTILRPAAITGPRGRYQVKRFGLQSVLQKGLPIIPIAKKTWCRQFIHEDDVSDIVTFFSFGDLKHEFEIFNVTPNSVVLARDMAEIMGKSTMRITPAVVRIAFFVLWHISRGRVPTSRGGWKFYSYPIVMDGRKLTRMYGYNYKYESRPALERMEGRYVPYVRNQRKEDAG